jgi:hypothetical protein
MVPPLLSIPLTVPSSPQIMSLVLGQQPRQKLTYVCRRATLSCSAPLQAPTALLCSIYRFGCESVPRPSRGSCWYIPCTSAPGLLTTGLQLTVVVHQVCAERGTSDYLVYQRLIDKQVPSQDCRSLSFSEHPSPDLHVLPICLSSHFGVRGTLAPRSRFRTVGSPRTVKSLGRGAWGKQKDPLQLSGEAYHP